MKQWHILGAGAMGCLFAYRMMQKRCPGVLLHHREDVSQRRLLDGNTQTQLPVRFLHSLAPKSIDRLLLGTKAGQVIEALTQARPYLAKNAVIVSTANGLGFENAFTHALPQQSLYRAVSTAAAFRDSAGTVHRVTDGLTRIGLPGTDMHAPDWFCDSLESLGSWRWDSNIARRIGEKFSLNCIINPLTATLGCRNGELLTDGNPGTELAALCAESEPALKALKLWSQEESLLNAAIAVCKSTSQNQSSMLQDRIAHRRTEIDFLNGELLRRAASLGLALPLNKALLAALS